MSANFLASMAGESQRRIAIAKDRVSYGELVEHIGGMDAPPALRLHDRFDVVAEVKLRSPAAAASAGHIGDLSARVAAYAAGGAAAVSVLTEPSRFEGSIFHLMSAARVLLPLRRPALRKDFLVDAYQLAEARVAGAAGALLILRLLEAREIAGLVTVARSLGLFLLLEAFDESDLALARSMIAELGPAGLLVGVNCRDLATLQVRPDRLRELADRLPADIPCVAESGLATPEDAQAAARAGYRAALVGSALMKADDPRSLVSDMIDAGRRA
jgi:indole-3-glycerol phosphate synthase